jgi:hypothetical protein
MLQVPWSLILLVVYEIQNKTSTLAPDSLFFFFLSRKNTVIIVHYIKHITSLQKLKSKQKHPSKTHYPHASAAINLAVRHFPMNVSFL